jgi:hypothetical protein
MNDYTEDMLRVLTRERHDLRLREADAERLTRELRATAQRRRRLRAPINLVVGAGQRLSPRRLET